MAVTHYEGPIIVGGEGVVINNYRPTYNADSGPSMFQYGAAMNDPRWRYQDGSPSLRMIGWQGATYVPVLDQVPATASATGLAAAQAGTSGTALTLTTSTSTTTGIMVLGAATTVYPARTLVPATAIVLDGAPALLSYGQTGGIAEYDPTHALGRAVVVTWAGSDAAGSVLVSGYDTYGYAMSEKIAGASGTTSAGKKAFKFISSAVPGGTVTGSNISLGTLDVFGLPLRADRFAYATAFFNNVLLTSSGFVAADATSPATTATGDVRGTWAPGVADGTKRLQVFITPAPVNLQASASTALAGVTQV